MKTRPAKTETTAPKADIYDRLTASIVEALESAVQPTEWPWIKAAKAGAPVNVVSKKGYRGINRMILGMAVFSGASRFWATFRQWQDKGAIVRKGEKGTPIVFYGELFVDENEKRVSRDTPGARKILYAKGATVFSADQVDGWEAPAEGSSEAAELAAGADEIDDIEAWISNTHAHVIVEGDRAFYSPGVDRITMPARSLFKTTATASATQHFYGVMLHELAHWTGHARRLDRLTADAFGSAGYAKEELVAEIASAFLSADLGISPQPRADNVSYVSHWLAILKADKRAIVNAASAASKAADFLHSLQPRQIVEEVADIDDEEEPAALAA